ncbi:MAG: hypothetical protein DIU78_021245, partial [Pseudomonadota bacterium]
QSTLPPNACAYLISGALGEHEGGAPRGLFCSLAEDHATVRFAAVPLPELAFLELAVCGFPEVVGVWCWRVGNLKCERDALDGALRSREESRSLAVDRWVMR